MANLIQISTKELSMRNINKCLLHEHLDKGTTESEDSLDSLSDYHTKRGFVLGPPIPQGVYNISEEISESSLKVQQITIKYCYFKFLTWLL